MLAVFDMKSAEYAPIEGESHDPFLHIEYDAHQGRLVLTSGFLGTALTTYLALESDRLYISDSLLRIKSVLHRRFSLNVQVLPYFFYNGFLPGEHTLVKGIYKLPPKKRIIAEKGSVRMEDNEMALPETRGDGQPAEELYDETMRSAVSRSLPDAEKYTVALSGGFDSNYLLYMIKKIKPRARIDCFSVGGTVGVDETKTAEKISKMYEDTAFFSTLVSSDTLRHLDEIVYRLEGSVYERGIFLQYELAKMLHEHHCTHLICGECADQVFHPKTYSPTPGDTFLFGYADTPYEMASYVVLKKSAEMLRSFGIRGIYPYLDEAVIKLGYLTRTENGDNKAFHRAQCERRLPSSVYGLLKKIGGSTELLPLMDEGTDYEGLCRDSRYYDPSFRYTEKYSKKEAVMDYYLSLKYIESFERQFCDDEK